VISPISGWPNLKNLHTTRRLVSCLEFSDQNFVNFTIRSRSSKNAKISKKIVTSCTFRRPLLCTDYRSMEIHYQMIPLRDAKTAEAIETLFGLRTRVGPRNHVLDIADCFKPNTVLWVFHTIQPSSFWLAPLECPASFVKAATFQSM